ncbi:hypothetical protein [Spirosoma sp. 48-14]|uniref:hypothetical protein n=1 Tax=Spirosoma sp. 48-14 TaxID=1895854 RepID=UPI0009689402|nr:hypothetical protein [Spirosoma sp. 48-14]OJW76299.1 MAG: hypothetical protein BGO59_22535 [Spirosoma sp. 48-14]
MKLFLLRFWLLFNLADGPDEVDIAGGICTGLAIPLNLIPLFSMQTINGFLTIVISLLSVAWLSMRCYREWGATKKYIATQKAQDDEED